MEPLYEVEDEHLGVAALSQFSIFNSASRLAMYLAYLSQGVMVEGIHERELMSGLDLDLGEASMSIRAPCDLEVIAVISKFPKQRTGPRLLIYADLHQTMSCIELPGYKSSHDEHGWLYKRELDLYPGRPIRAGVIIESSPSYCKGGGYKFGVGLKTMFATDPRSTEDGFVIRRGVLEESLAYTSISTVSVEIDQDDIPMTIYGDRTHPGIGQYIREDGLVMCTRSKTSNSAVLSKKALGHIDPWSDKCRYAQKCAGGKVIDMDITRGLGASIGLSGVTAGLDDDDDTMYAYAKSVWNVYRSAKESAIGSLVIKHEFNSLLTSLRCVLDRRSTEFKRPQPTRKKKSITGYRITFKIAKRVLPTYGFKMVDLYGGKGVFSCIVRDDEEMPVDGNGVPVDVIVNAASTFGRMNVGRLPEQFISASFDTYRRELVGRLGLPFESPPAECRTALAKLSLDEFDWFWARTMTLLEIVSPDHAAHFKDLGDADRQDWLTEWLGVRVSVKFTIKDAMRAEAIEAALQREFPPMREPLFAKHPDGTVERFPATITGKLYYMLLEPTPKKWSGVSSGPTQIHGVIHSPSKDSKSSYPYPFNPGKFVGEAEAFAIAAVAGTEAVATIMDRNCSTDTHRILYRGILMSAKPGAPECLVNTATHQLGSSNSIKFLMSHAESAGYTFKYRTT